MREQVVEHGHRAAGGSEGKRRLLIMVLVPEHLMEQVRLLGFLFFDYAHDVVEHLSEYLLALV